MNNLRGRTYATDAGHDHPERLLDKLTRVLREESQSLQPRLLLIHFIASLIPRYTGGRIRAQLLRSAGVPIGKGTVVLGAPLLYGTGPIQKRIRIGKNGIINIGCVFDLSAPITVGDGVGIGHEVMLLTSSHLIGSHMNRAGNLTTAPVTIGNGAWLGARSVVLPGMNVGEGSVVGSGAIVTKDVPANTLVGGIPARVIRPLD